MSLLNRYVDQDQYDCPFTFLDFTSYFFWFDIDLTRFKYGIKI